MYQKILVATDGSSLSKKAIKGAIDLAAAIDAELLMVNVVGRYPMTYFEGGATLPMADVSQIEKQWASQGLAVANAAKNAAESAGVTAKATIVRSNLVAEAILSAARKNKCDLIVMASHGRKGLKRILLGSETQQVLTHSSIPVLVLR